MIARAKQQQIQEAFASWVWKEPERRDTLPLVGQWATEFYRFFPNANLLVSTAEDFTPKNRNRYISKIATGEYDAVILAHSQFEKIPISTERQIAMLERQINDIENAIHGTADQRY